MVLKYHDPVSGVWVALPGVPGPTGPTGASGTGADEVAVQHGPDPVDAHLELWVDLDDPAGAAEAGGPAGMRKVAVPLVGTPPEVITHGLGTRDLVIVVMQDSAPYAAVTAVSWEATTLDTATVTYPPDLGPGYHVVCVG